MRTGESITENGESRRVAGGRAGIVAVALALGACGSVAVEPDGSVAGDAGPDAALVDAASGEGGSADAGSADAGASDAGTGGARCARPLGFERLQFGTPEDDSATSVGIADDCGLYIVGTTRGKLAEGAAGGQDLFLRRIGEGASDSFVVQLGSPEDELASAVTVTPGGDAVVVGSTAGVLPTVERSIGLEDAFVVRYGASGARRWLAQLGTLGNDFLLDVAMLPDGHVLVAGTSDEFPERGYDVTLDELSGEDGSRRIGQRRGTLFVDRAEGLALGPDGRLVVVGATVGSLAGPHRGSSDAFVQAFEWLGASPGLGAQLGTPDIDAALDAAVAADGTIFVALVSFADLASGADENDGIQSAFVARIAPTGELLGTTRLAPTGMASRAVAIVADPRGGALVAGSVVGPLGGTDAGGRDAMLWSLDSSGAVRATVRFGSSADDEARDLLVTAAGEVVVVGSAGAALGPGGESAGGLDAFVARTPLP